MRKCLGLLFSLWLIGLTGGLYAGIREQSVFIEGEDFSPSNEEWQPREGWGDDIYTATSGDAVLAHPGHGQGTAQANVMIPTTGEYNVWIRYLKIGTYPGSFGLRILQNGQIVFDEKYRTKPEGNDWRDVWEKFPAQLQAGPATLTLYIAQPGIRQRVDCVLLTADLQYQPNYRDFAPQTFVRFRLLEPALPVIATLNTYLKRAPVYYYHPGRITANGLGAAGPEIVPGEWSPWIDISRFMDSGRWLTTAKFAFTSGQEKLERLKIEWQISPAPEEAQALTLLDDLDGHISSLILPGDIRKFRDKIELCSANTAKHLRMAQELRLPPLAGPMRMDVEAHICGFGDAYASTRMLAQEMETARILGFNCFDNLYGLRARVAAQIGVRRGFLSHWMPHTVWKCPTDPGLPELLDEHFARQKEIITKDDPQALERHKRNKLYDEPGTSDLKHLAECESCRKAFVEYLQQWGLKPEDFGQTNWAALKPISREEATDAASRRLYYWSIQFRDWTNARLFRQATEAAEKHLGPRILQMTNFTDMPLSGWASGLIEGPDWFLFGRMRATTLMWSEDWAALGPEVSGYITDMLRAAGRPHKLPIGEYIIANHNPTMPQRALSAVMHGARTLHFYCYGPYYAFLDGMISDNPETMRTLGRLTRFLAKADPYVYPAQLSPAAVAILYGKSHEIWQRDAAVATERRSVYLATHHAHIPVDILSEDDVAEGLLKGYKVLYVTESNIRRDAARQIALWVRAGGVLQMCAGAGLRDEYDEPLQELIQLAGVQVAEVTKPGGDYREHYGLRQQKIRSEATFRLAGLKESGISEQKISPPPAAITFPVLGYSEQAQAVDASVIATFTEGQPAGFVHKAGRGFVLRYAFMPGLGYVRSANIKATDLITGHKPEQLWLLTLPIRLAGVVAPLSVSEPLVQARLLTGPQADVVCLANWSGQPVSNLRVTLRGRPSPRVFALSGVAVKTQQTKAGLEVSFPLEDIEVLVLPKK